MECKVRRTAIDVVGDVPWGTHFCQFYQTKEDLIDILVPYFRAGLKDNEFCMWVISEPLNVEDAKKALKKKVKDLDDYIKKGQIEILDYSQWYTKSGHFDSDKVLQGWVEKEKQALEKGFEGLRLTGNTFWLEEEDWEDFTNYEAAIKSVIGQHRMLVVCTYCLDKCTASEIVDVVSNHQFALIERKGKWEIIESAEHKKTAEAMQESEQKYRAIFEQAADSIVLIDRQTGELVEFNDRAYENLGYTREEFQRLKIPDFEVFESSEQVAKHITKIVGQGADAFETKHRTKSGEIRDILVSSRPISIGGRDFVQSIWRDITERKQAEQYLKRERDKLINILDSMADGVYIANQQYDIEYVNPILEKEFGKVKGRKCYEYFHDRAEVCPWCKNKDVFKGKTVRWEWYSSTNGKTYDLLDTPVHNADGSISKLEIFRDITEHKQAQEQVQNLAKFPSENPNPVLRIAKDGVLLYANAAGGSLLAEWRCKVGQIVPENWSQMVSEVFASNLGKRVEIEHAGRIFSFMFAPVTKAGYVNIYGRDITERKEIAARQELARRILAHLNQKSGRLDLIHDVVELVKEFTGFAAVGVRLREGEDFPYFEVSGFSNDFIEAENYLCARNENGEQVFDEKGHPVLACMCGSVIVGRADPALPFFTEGGSFWTNSTTELLTSSQVKAFRVPTRNRCNQEGYESVALIPLRSGEETVGLLQLNDTQPERFTPEMIRFFEEIGAGIGIALARIRAEENVKNLAKFPSENPNPVLRIAKDGTVLYANFAGSELLKDWGCEVGARIPEHWHQYVLRILKSGLSEELETVCCKDKIFSLIIAPVMDAGYVNMYGIDVTERKKAEEDLRKYRQHLEELVQTRTGELTEANKQLLQEIEQRKGLEKALLDISEREQRRIGQELHDSLGQQLTGIAFMTKVLEQKLATKLPEEAARVEEIGKLVNQATDQARGLAKGLHPVDLDAGTLMSALQELATSTEHLFRVHCTFKCDKPIPIDDAEVVVHLYRITQEAVNNAIKHGRAKNIQIGLSYGKKESVLTVKSDGVDFPKEFEKRGTGMGLQIMDHRVDIIGGSLNIHSAPKGGTIVTCTFPNKNTHNNLEKNYGSEKTAK